MTEGTLTYVLVVAAVGLLATIRAALWLGKASRLQRERVFRRRRFEAVRTSTPVEHPNDVARDRALKSIEQHFTVSRRLAVPGILLITLILASLPFLSEVPAAALSVVAAAITVLAGVAARPFVENAIAGLVISVSKIVNIGDTVQLDGMRGTVEDITLTHTTIKVWDWRRYAVPNGQMLTTKFVNMSLYDTYLWAHVEFSVSYEVDLKHVERLAIAAVRQSHYFVDHEAPVFWVMSMNPQAIVCWVAGWSNTPSDAWMLEHDIRTALARDFKREGIPSHVYRHAFEASSAHRAVEAAPGETDATLPGGATVAAVARPVLPEPQITAADEGAGANDSQEHRPRAGGTDALSASVPLGPLKRR